MKELIETGKMQDKLIIGELYKIVFMEYENVIFHLLNNKKGDYIILEKFKYKDECFMYLGSDKEWNIKNSDIYWSSYYSVFLFGDKIGTIRTKKDYIQVNDCYKFEIVK